MDSSYYFWPSDPRGATGAHNEHTFTALGVQMEMLNRRMDGLPAVQSPDSCEFCGGNHSSYDCQLGNFYNPPSYEKTNFGFDDFSRNATYGDSCNFGWKNNSNFSWSQNAWGQQPIKYQSWEEREQPTQEKTSLEEMIERFISGTEASCTNQEVFQPLQESKPPVEENSDLEDMLARFISRTEASFSNQEANIQNLEVQIGRLANMLSEQLQVQSQFQQELNQDQQSENSQQQIQQQEAEEEIFQVPTNSAVFEDEISGVSTKEKGKNAETSEEVQPTSMESESNEAEILKQKQETKDLEVKVQVAYSEHEKEAANFEEKEVAEDLDSDLELELVEERDEYAVEFESSADTVQSEISEGLQLTEPTSFSKSQQQQLQHKGITSLAKPIEEEEQEHAASKEQKQILANFGMLQQEKNLLYSDFPYYCEIDSYFELFDDMVDDLVQKESEDSWEEEVKEALQDFVKPPKIKKIGTISIYELKAISSIQKYSASSVFDREGVG